MATWELQAMNGVSRCRRQNDVRCPLGQWTYSMLFTDVQKETPDASVKALSSPPNTGQSTSTTLAQRCNNIGNVIALYLDISLHPHVGCELLRQFPLHNE